ncbi:hypothetical protein ABH940_002837 [Streptacidiphilus sp. BW17]
MGLAWVIESHFGPGACAQRNRRNWATPPWPEVNGAKNVL